VLLAEDPVVLSTGNTAWILASSALVLLMTPGLALFYGGMTKTKSVLNMFMMSFSAIGLVSILWLVYGFSVAFGDDVNGLWGNLTQYLGSNVAPDALWGALDIPVYVFIAFQMMFAVITVALISGSIADRAKFLGWLVFAFAWATLVYFPVAHWVWGGGWIGAKLGALDFAGGTAVHINAGAAALALAIVLGKRVGWPKDKFKPHNVPMVALGAGLLWFGWFGFNAGSELAADGIAALAFVNTQVATAAALVGWLIVEWIRDGKPTLLGASSGAIAGLVAITPACAFITPVGAIALGLVAGVICALAVSLKYKLGYDDSLDVVGVHLVGGLVGSLAIGFIGTAAVGGVSVDGLFYGGGFGQLGKQAIASFAVLAYSFVVALILGFLVDKTIGFRLKPEAEAEGIDVVEHAESAYDLSPASSAGAFALAGVTSPAPAKAAKADAEEAAPATDKVSG
jgi:Amt family ammonium transporter